MKKSDYENSFEYVSFSLDFLLMFLYIHCHFFIMSHSYDNWCCSVELMESLDSPPKAMVFSIYAETIDIA